MNIRSATSNDFEAIESLWRGADLPTVPHAEWQTLVDEPAANVLLAEEEGQLAGAAVASFDGWRGYIYHLAVGPEWRHHGVGTALMRAAEEWVASKNGREIYVMAHEQNTDGLALAAEAGFDAIVGEVVLRKEIAAP